MKPFSSLIFLILLLLAGMAQSHHSFTLNFDMSRQIELRGTVVDFKLRSPHSSMVIDGQVFEDDQPVGEIERWEIESSAAGGLRAMEIQSDTFQAGDSITLIANPNREAAFRFVNSSTFITNGQTYSRANIRPPERVSGDELTGIEGLQRLEGRWSSPGGFGQGTPLPLNDRGRALADAFDPKLSPANTCEPMNFPDIFNAPYLFDLRIEDNTVVLYNVPWEVERRIPLNGQPTRPRLDGLFGVVMGRIEGSSIVLESGGYIPSRWGLGSATQKLGGGVDIPSSARKRLNEKFSVSEDGQTLIYEYTVSDSAYLAAPYNGSNELSRVADSTPLYDYDCEVEAASMFSRSADDPALEIGE